MYGLLCYDNIWPRYNYLKIWNLRVQKNLNIEKITFKVVQMKFLAMHITKQKLSFYIFTVRNLQNILMKYDLYLISYQLQSLNIHTDLQVFRIILIIPTQMRRALYCNMITQSCNGRKLDASSQIGLTYTNELAVLSLRYCLCTLRLCAIAISPCFYS